jgi:hypothetical protein
MDIPLDLMDMKILQILYQAAQPVSIWHVHNELNMKHGYTKTDSRVQRLHKHDVIEMNKHQNGRKRFSITDRKVCRPGSSIIYFFGTGKNAIPAILHCEYKDGGDCDCTQAGQCRLDRDLKQHISKEN